MKFAIIGKGKTGKAVIASLDSTNISNVFDSKNTPTIEMLDQADVVIVFISSEALTTIMPVLLGTSTPIVCGTTGFAFTDDFITKVNIRKNTWVIANNFSLSMVFIKQALESLGKIQNLIPQAQYKINETHHTQKVDVPSGTAISWEQWLNVDKCPISSIREGDVKGIHIVNVDYEYESIQFEHIAHDRKLFAQGAIWAANYIHNNPQICGFNQFETLVNGATNGY
jgi:4-hydroxy-tetrahydrodipicolinate reductase